MTVAYPCLSKAPTQADIHDAVCDALAGLASPRADGKQWLSLTLPLPPLDLLSAFELIDAGEQGCYWENPHAREGLVAGGSVSQWTSAGGDRFGWGQQVADAWLSQTLPLGVMAAPDVRIVCRFAFNDGLSSSSDLGGLSGLGAAASLTLPEWQVTRCQEVYRFTTNLSLDALRSPAAVEAACGQAWRQYKTLCQSARLPQRASQLQSKSQALGLSLSAPDLPHLTRLPAVRERQRQFVASAEALLHAIEQGQLTKVVLASAIDLVPQAPVSTAMALRRLRRRYGGCHVFAVRSGKQTFLGASPERLFRIRQLQLYTSAIAGSASRGATVMADRRFAAALARSDKERHEHRIVADFIFGRLQGLGLRPMGSPTPEILRLANIQHLHTPITAALPPQVHPLQIVAALHPTPAMAGLPQKAACEAIA
ncbi:MAG: chorismate-binding protein, partial [Cyanobacteria bacterium P01_A01_bin.135]